MANDITSKLKGGDYAGAVGNVISGSKNEDGSTSGGAIDTAAVALNEFGEVLSEYNYAANIGDVQQIINLPLMANMGQDNIAVDVAGKAVWSGHWLCYEWKTRICFCS